MRVRIVVADQTEARFYDGMGFVRPLIQVGLLTNPTGRMRDQDLVSDRPGRVFERAADPHHRRGEGADGQHPGPVENGTGSGGA